MWAELQQERRQKLALLIRLDFTDQCMSGLVAFGEIEADSTLWATKREPSLPAISRAAFSKLFVSCSSSSTKRFVFLGVIVELF